MLVCLRVDAQVVRTEAGIAGQKMKCEGYSELYYTGVYIDLSDLVY